MMFGPVVAWSPPLAGANFNPLFVSFTSSIRPHQPGTSTPLPAIGRGGGGGPPAPRPRCAWPIATKARVRMTTEASHFCMDPPVIRTVGGGQYAVGRLIQWAAYCLVHTVYCVRNPS